MIFLLLILHYTLKLGMKNNILLQNHKLELEVFRDFAKKKRIWEEKKNNKLPKPTIYEFLDRTKDPDAHDYWKNKCGDNFKIHTESFIMYLVTYFGARGIEIPAEINVLIDSTGDGVVSLIDFSNFCHVFGPFKESMTNAEDILQHKWFFGCLSSYEAQKLLEKQSMGTYLLRYDQQENVESGLVISCTELDSDNKVKTLHFKVCSKNMKKKR